MAKYKLFSVRDAKAEAFLAINPAVSTAAAIRAFQDAVADAGTPFNKHPEDYALFQLAEYDELSGEVVGLPQPLHVIDAIECVEKAS